MSHLYRGKGAGQGCLQCHNPLITFVYQLIHLSNWQAKANKVWAVPDSLATTTGIVVYFLFLALLRCFSSGGYLLPILYIQISVIRHYSNRVSPFGHLRIKTYLAVPRSFSQLITSFFGITCQGILCVRLSNFLRNRHKIEILYLLCNWLEYLAVIESNHEHLLVKTNARVD